MLKTNPELLILGVIIWVLAFPVFLLDVQAQGGPQNWTGPENNYPLNWNYNPQNTINASNVHSLQVDWTFPVPSAPAPYVGAEGAMITPLIINGIIFTITNWHRVFALNANTGQVIWFKDLPISQNYSGYLQPSIPAGVGYNTGALGHYHAMLYTSQLYGQSLVWVVANTYQIFALSALTGDIVVNFQPFNSLSSRSIPGNYGLYDEDTPIIMIDQNRGILIFSPSVTEGTSAGRGFIEAYDLKSSPPHFLWRDFLLPPQDGSDPGWSLSAVGNATFAYVFNGTGAINLKSLPASQLHSMLYGDWGNFDFNGTISFAGMSGGWGGSWALDQASGTMYAGTSQASPDWNATTRPGPNLWSDSVLALNDSSGKISWGFQTEAHSLGDFDCSWNVLLANATIGGHTQKVVYKGCKDGYLFALNAVNGSLLWYLKPTSVKWVSVAMLNPENNTQMTAFNWYGYPSNAPIIQNPSDTGSLESDLAFDPSLNTIFLAPYNYPKQFQITDVGPPSGHTLNQSQWEFQWGTNITAIMPVGGSNTTILAVDASSGVVRWSYFIRDQPYRGGLTVSGGVLYISTYDGVLTMLDASSGRLLSQKNIGGALLIQPSIGEDSVGNMKLVLTDMGSARWGPVFPGFIQVLSLPLARATSNDASASNALIVAIVVAGFFALTTALLFLRNRRS